ncbi:unnamed protein product [Albugo candida]|uniref:Uncharacterized protein n=1 Tax=Albugo candida TaxID=65357 RepID=A0A024FU05_9STRA|nr:unnamed protein product [Albugo candida]|eukprot:CCI10605.1 unnamed protein product [Albugo candida]
MKFFLEGETSEPTARCATSPNQNIPLHFIHPITPPSSSNWLLHVLFIQFFPKTTRFLNFAYLQSFPFPPHHLILDFFVLHTTQSCQAIHKKEKSAFSYANLSFFFMLSQHRPSFSKFPRNDHIVLLHATITLAIFPF